MPDEKPEPEEPVAKDGAETTAEPGETSGTAEPSAAEPSAAEPSAAEPAGEPAAEASGEPSGKRKKRKRKRAAEEEVVLRPSLRPDGRERPAFLLSFPSDPELERLIRAFELGNYALVRKGAPELAERTTDAKVRAAAEELARRIEPDPLVKVLLGLSIALLVVLTLWAYKTHGG